MKDNLQIIKDDAVDLHAFFQVLWTARKLISKITGLITFIAILYALLATPLYKSTITMYPSSDSGSGTLSQLQGMASMFGVNVGGSESIFHIPDIINSRTLRTKIIYKKWNSIISNTPIDLISYWGIDKDNFFSPNSSGME